MTSEKIDVIVKEALQWTLEGRKDIARPKKTWKWGRIKSCGQQVSGTSDKMAAVA